MSKHICFTIDLEPDISRLKTGFMGMESGVQLLLEIFESFGISATWFVTHDNWAKVDKKYPKLLKEIKKRGHEMGLHVHFEENGKYSMEPEFQRRLIKRGVESLRSNGHIIKSFRGGEFQFDDNTLRLLEELKFEIDSSVVPGFKISRPNGFYVNHKKCFTYKPYHPSYNNYCVPGEATLLEFPVAVYMGGFGPIKIRKILTQSLIQNDPEGAFNIMENIECDPLVIPCHPWELIKNGKIERNYLRNLEKFISLAEHYEFSTLSDAMKKNTTGVALKFDNMVKLKSLLSFYKFSSRLNRGTQFMKWLYSGISYFRSLEYPLTIFLLRMKKDMMLLDIGSGSSLFPLFLANGGYNLYATDLEVNSIHQTLENNLNRFPDIKIHIQKQDARRLTYKKESFDRVTAISTLEHIDDEGDIWAIREMSRVLKKEGRIVITLPFGIELKEGLHDGDFIRIYDYESIKSRIVEPSGLDIEEEIYFAQKVPLHKIFYPFSYNWRRRLSILQMVGSLLSLYITKDKKKAVGICLVLKKR